MKVCYLAGPYRGTSKNPIVNYLQRQANIHRAEKSARKLWADGWAVICPHCNSANFDNSAPCQYFLDGYLEVVKRVDRVIILPGWIGSSGTRKEISTALDNKIPVYEIYAELDEVIMFPINKTLLEVAKRVDEKLA